MPKQNKTWIIYRHISPSGKSYIGQTCYAQNPNIRWNSGHGYKRCKSFYNAIKKYGWKNIKHEIIETNIKTLEKANQREQYWIEYYDSCHNGYNDTKGGQVLPEVFDNKNKLSVSIGDKYGKYTIIGNPYVYGKRSVVLCKCECGVENVVRLSELCSGKIQSCLHCRNTHKKHNINDLIGKKFGRLTIINEASNIRYIGEDHHRIRTITCQCECGNIINVNIQSILQGATISCGCFQKEKACRKVKCVETGIIYHSIKEASEKTNICRDTIGKVCGKDIRYKTAGGYHWEYVNNN